MIPVDNISQTNFSIPSFRNDGNDKGRHSRTWI